jgi:hypothetical protein
MTTDQLTRALTDTLDAVTPPAPDLADVVSRGRHVKRRRRLTVAAVTVGAVAAAWIGAYQLADQAADVIRPDADIAVPGGFGMENGLRAVASPGVRLFLGDTSVPIRGGDFMSLDTDAAASSYGVLYTDRAGVVQLLEPTGDTRPLTDPGQVRADAGATIKVDPATDLAAWMTYDDGKPSLQVYDLAGDHAVATAPSPCLGDCDALVIDAISGGRVVLRGEDGTMTWNWTSEDQAWVPFAGPATRVADVQNGVVLYDGARPTRMPDGWRAVRGPVDGLLTHDGGHVVAWDKVLPSTVPGGRPIRLDAGRSIFFTVDTDGSVLTATLSPSEAFDCEIPSGECEKYADIPPGGGDPLHIGADM